MTPIPGWRNWARLHSTRECETASSEFLESHCRCAVVGVARCRRIGWSILKSVDSSGRDKGHFIAHAIGGGLDMNVFSQARDLNRGISEQGKVYRLMERYCYENAGTFCFSRPVYDDATSIPRWVEFGLLRDDGSLWVEVFEN